VKKELRYLLFLLPVLAWSQDADTLKSKPLRPALYIDYAKAISSAFPNNQRWEGGVEFMFLDRIQTIVEMGKWDVSPESAISNGEYQMDGTYMRYGVGYVPYVDAMSRIGLGFRYATATFSDQGNYTIVSGSELQPDFVESFDRINLTATWFEAVFYSDKEIKKWLTAGFTFRVRFMQSYDSFENPDVVIVPGYGRAQDKAVPAVNLFLKIQPF
jgi:hypothetical protein